MSTVTVYDSHERGMDETRGILRVRVVEVYTK